MHTLYLLGDSTCAHKKKEAFPETGWGDEFYFFLNKDWSVDNRALNGRSTRSFINEGEYEKIIQSARSGDSAIIQFGHNDSKTDKERYSAPFGAYVDNLLYMGDRLRKNGISVYFVTSIARRHFDEEGILIQTHGDYPAAMKYAGYKGGYPVADATTATMLRIQELGVEKSKKIYMNLEKGEYPNYPEGKEDNSHLTPNGAKWIAGIIAKELSFFKPPFLSEEIDTACTQIDYSSLEVVD